MTQQLKFGDRVRRKSDGATGVVIHQQFQSVWVVFEGSTTSDVDYADEFELIPHPDTIRLDWLLEKDPQLRSRWCKDEHDNLRDAIDAAMKETN